MEKVRGNPETPSWPCLPGPFEEYSSWARAHRSFFLAAYLRWREGSDDDAALPGRRDDDEVGVIAEAMAAKGVSMTTVQRFLDCRGKVHVLRENKTGDYFYRVYSCMNRFCPTCRAQNAQAISVKLARLSEQPKRRLAFLTLTQIPQKDESLRDAFRRLRRAFTKFRGSDLWKSRVFGAMSVFEVTRSKSIENAWHVHVHLVVDTAKFGFDPLCQEWNRCRGFQGSGSGVHIATVEDGRAVSRYLCEYLSKGCAVEEFVEAGCVEEFVEAMHRSRLVEFFAGWRGKGKAKDGMKDFAGLRQERVGGRTFTHVGELRSLIWAARQGQKAAVEVLEGIGFWPLQRQGLDFSRRNHDRTETERRRDGPGADGSRAGGGLVQNLFDKGAIDACAWAA